MRNSEEMRRLSQYRRFADDKVMRSSRLHNLGCVEDALCPESSPVFIHRGEQPGMNNSDVVPSAFENALSAG